MINKTNKKSSITKIILITISLFISVQLFAQNGYNDLEKIVMAYKDTTEIKNRMEYVMRNEFNQLVSSNTNGIIGDYIGISTEDKTLALAYNFIRENSSLELNFSGAANDNIAGILVDDKFKTGIQFGLKYNKIIGNNSISLNFTEVEAIQKKIKDLKNDKNLKLLKNKQSIIDKSNVISKKDSILNELKKKKDVLIKKPKSTNNSKLLEELNNWIKIAQLEVKKAQQDFTYEKENAIIARQNTYVDERNKALDEFRELRAIDVNLTWFSLGFNISNESYSFINTELAPEDQIFKENDAIPSFGITYSSFSSSDSMKSTFENFKRISFHSIGASVKFGNNINSMKELNIETIDTISANRISINSQKAFTGSFDKEVISALLSFDYYELGFTKHNFGFHIRGTMEFGSGFPNISLRTGFIFSAKKADDTNAIANFEIFYGLNDILKVGGENSILKRNIIGIQTTFPFNFK